MRQAGTSLTVVVPTRDRSASLDVCLASIRAALRPGDELIVVDSASVDPGVKAAAEAHGARYLRCERRGASRARNFGWRNATHDLVAFIDDDVRVAPTWAQGFADAFAEHPDTGFMTGRIEVPPGQEAERPVALKEETEPYVLDASIIGTAGHSANLAAHRWALEKVGGFDERLGPGGDFRNTEDMDIFDRFYAAGMLGRYEPRAHAWHDQWRTRKELIRLDWAYGFGMGARASKLLRIDRPRARMALEELFWTWGMRDVIQFLRMRWRFMALTSLVRVFGGVAGIARALPVGVKDGHFLPPRPLLSRLRRGSRPGSEPRLPGPD